jgi:hypothetical protein
MLVEVWERSGKDCPIFVLCVKANLFGSSCCVGADPFVRALRVSNAWILRCDETQISGQGQGQERLREPNECRQAPDRPKSKVSVKFNL